MLGRSAVAHVALVAACVGCPGRGESRSAPVDAATQVSTSARMPLAAVWRKVGRRPMPGRSFEGPALRYAVFEDGEILFAEDRDSLRGRVARAKLDSGAIAELERSLADTGVMDLTGTTYLVPDAPVLAMLVRVRGREQILYWDEVELPGYGINVAPKPHHLAFKKAWHAVDAVLAERVAKAGKTDTIEFTPPSSWSIKPAIQSE
jgi:hypothetical protein